MPATYTQADEARLYVENMVASYHPDLADAGVTYDLLFAWPPKDENDDPTGPAITVNGRPAYACIRQTKLKERAAGRADVEITIDGLNWQERSASQRDALIDHELTHLEFKTDKTGGIKRDDLNRPVFKMREHDFEVGWFTEVAERHKDQSVEVQQAAKLMDQETRQIWFPWMFADEAHAA